MGNVWLATDEQAGRPVALKEIVLTPDGEDPAVRRERALREAEAAQRIDHPGIVEIYDVFLDDDEQPWIVMAYIKGRTLADLIEERALGEREVARFGLHVVDALSAAHLQGVIHRDVKPTNIVISEADEVFLVDFGIAHLRDRGRLTSNVIGTPDFLAPECFHRVDPGPAADLWSLGITLFNALEGRRPFHRETPAETMYAILRETPPLFGRRGPLADAIGRLLVKDPRLRMTAGELGAALDRVANGRPKPPVTPPPVPTSVRGLPVKQAARLVADAPAGDAARMLTDLSPQEARDVLVHIGGRQAARILLTLANARSAEIVAVTPSRSAGALLDEMAVADADLTASIMEILSATLAGQALNYAGHVAAAAVIGAMPVAEAVRVLTRTSVHTSAGVVDELKGTDTAVRLVEAMSVPQAASVLGYLSPATVAALLRESSDGRKDRLLGSLTRSARTQVVRLLSEAADHERRAAGPG